MRTRNRVFLYITFSNQLLVVTHVHHPEIGLQVPGGTIEDGELPEAAALREAEEETGLKNLEIVALLGQRKQDMTEFGRNEELHCWYYHLEAIPPVPKRWQHTEDDPSSGNESSILFELHWHPLTKPLELGGIDDRLLPELIASMQSGA